MASSPSDNQVPSPIVETSAVGDITSNNEGQIKKAGTLPVAVSPQVAGETNGANGKESVTASQPACPCPEENRQRSAPQPMKRRPDKDLNHDNWDEEDEPEEKGEFIKASEEKLKDRKILTARRKQTSTSAATNPFGAINLAAGSGFGGFGGGTSVTAPAFNFSTAQTLPPTPAFNFSTTQSQSTLAVPIFDFSSISSNPTKPDKDDNEEQTKEVKTSKVGVTLNVDTETNNDKGNESVSQPPAPAEEGKKQRTAPQPMKRRPDTDLNHDNWDQEDEPEEKGEFVKASEDSLKNRKILTAKRKNQTSNSSTNPFGSINFGSGLGSNGGGVGTFSTPTPMFNFSTAQPLTTTTTPKFDFSNLWKDKDESKNEEDDDFNGEEEIPEATELGDV